MSTESVEKNQVNETSEDIILTGFKLKKNGLALEYTTYEPMKKGGIIMNGEVNRKSPFPPTHDVLAQVDRLRYFFAKACGMWYDGFEKFVEPDFSVALADKDDYEEFKKANNTIEAIHIDRIWVGDYYKISASVESMDKKFINTITPKIGEDDDMFEDLHEVMQDVLSTMKEFVRDSNYDIKKEAYDIVFRSIQNKEERLEVMNSMTERDILLNAIEIFESKGAMLMMSPELDQEIMAMRREKEQEESVKALNGVEITSEDANNIDMNEASNFAETDSVHEVQSEKTADQDWAVAGGLMDSKEDAERVKVVEEEFM